MKALQKCFPEIDLVSITDPLGSLMMYSVGSISLSLLKWIGRRPGVSPIEGVDYLNV